MPYPDALEACRLDLYTPDDDLRQRYPPEIVDKILRVRYLHRWYMANPEASDADAVREDISLHSVSRPTAYSDIRVIKALLPMMSEASKDFHRWRYREMILSTYSMAKKRGDTRTMERAASSYARYTRIDEEDTRDIPIELLLPQPFVPTDDPSVLGIARIPDLRRRQRLLLEKYTRETADISDIGYEPVDLAEETLFSEITPSTKQKQDIPGQ